MKIVDEEILVKGRNVACGYLGEQDGKIQEEDGWFHTGDLGEIDPEGFLFLKEERRTLLFWKTEKMSIRKNWNGNY